MMKLEDEATLSNSSGDLAMLLLLSHLGTRLDHAYAQAA